VTFKLVMAVKEYTCNRCWIKKAIQKGQLYVKKTIWKYGKAVGDFKLCRICAQEVELWDELYEEWCERHPNLDKVI